MLSQPLGWELVPPSLLPSSLFLLLWPFPSLWTRILLLLCILVWLLLLPLFGARGGWAWCFRSLWAGIFCFLRCFLLLLFLLLLLLWLFLLLVFLGARSGWACRLFPSLWTRIVLLLCILLWLLLLLFLGARSGWACRLFPSLWSGISCFHRCFLLLLWLFLLLVFLGAQSGSLFFSSTWCFLLLGIFLRVLVLLVLFLGPFGLILLDLQLQEMFCALKLLDAFSYWRINSSLQLPHFIGSCQTHGYMWTETKCF